MISIQARDLTKHYVVDANSVSRLARILGVGRRAAGPVRRFVALDGVSFDVEQGCSLGVIGPNGAGKSTLLKMLAGIVQPSSGTLDIRGRVASIIELGAGFHPEFTGRDNVRMNAAILEMPADETDRIVAQVERFSELGHYFDMPVRTYSSGMFVRLAFGVAIHQDPEILLVDEALAVGDAVFSHKCLDRIRAMRERGVTIVLVSHDTAAVAQACDQVLLLDRGRLLAAGAPGDVIHRYLVSVAERVTGSPSDDALASGASTQIGAVEHHDGGERRFGSFEARITEILVQDEAGQSVERVLSGQRVRFAMLVRFDTDVEDPVFGIMLRNRHGIEVFGTNTHLRRTVSGRYRAGQQLWVRFDVALLLGAGAYSVSFAVHTATGRYFDYRNDALLLEVVGAYEAGGIANLPATVELGSVMQPSGPDPSLGVVFPDAPSATRLEAEHSRYLLGQWHAFEGDALGGYRWFGTSASVVLNVPAGTTRVAVAVDCGSFVPRACELQAELDEFALGDVTLRPGDSGTVEFAVPAAAAGRIGVLRLQASSTFSEAAAQGGVPRLLSVQVRGVECVGEGASPTFAHPSPTFANKSVTAQ